MPVDGRRTPCRATSHKQTDISPESMLLSVPIVDLRTTCAIPSPPYMISGTQPLLPPRLSMASSVWHDFCELPTSTLG